MSTEEFYKWKEANGKTDEKGLPTTEKTSLGKAFYSLFCSRIICTKKSLKEKWKNTCGQEKEQDSA